MSIATFDKDPEASLPYEVNWTAWLAGRAIVTSVWMVPEGLTKDSDSHTNSAASVFLSGGIHGTNYEVTNHITTDGSPALEDERTITIRVMNQ